MVVGDFALDVSRLPIVKVAYPPVPKVEDFHAAFDFFTQLSLRGHPVAYLIDFRHFDPVRAAAATRKAAADCFLARAEIYRKVTVCEARVVTSAISRGTLTAFDWLTGTKWPCANFATVDEADAWICRFLERSGDAKLVGTIAAPRA